MLPTEPRKPLWLTRKPGLNTGNISWLSSPTDTYPRQDTTTTDPKLYDHVTSAMRRARTGCTNGGAVLAFTPATFNRETMSRRPWDGHWTMTTTTCGPWLLPGSGCLSTATNKVLAHRPCSYSRARVLQLQRDDELIPDDGDGNPSGQSLEEVLHCEAEVPAAELQELEESGDIDTAVLEELEAGVEQAAKSLVTMREARSRINEIKKDRGFGRAPLNSRLKLNGNQVEKKKIKTQCLDCGEFGHWGGDAQCSKPGAGLFKPKAAGKRPTAQKHVKVVESLNTEHVLTGHQLPMRSTWSTTIACVLRKPWNPQSRKTSLCLACHETKF